MTCPGRYPTVLDGRVIYKDNFTIEYECLPGHTMSGNKRLFCSQGNWNKRPTCTVIRQYSDPDVFPDWWFYAMTVLASIAILTCCLWLLCHYCCCRSSALSPSNLCGFCADCWANCCARRQDMVQHFKSRGPGNRTDRSSDFDVVRNAPANTQAGMFLVPVNSMHAPAGYLAVGPNPNDSKRHKNDNSKDMSTNTKDSDFVTKIVMNKSTNTDDEDSYKIIYAKPTRNQSTSTDDGDSYRVIYTRPTRNRSISPDNEDSYRVIYASRRAKEHERKLRAALAAREKKLRRAKALKNSVHFFESRSDGELHDRPAPSTRKNNTREVKLWMPHSHPIRNINTSTK